MDCLDDMQKRHEELLGRLLEMQKETQGDIKVLVTEFKSMNGSLRETKDKFQLHKVESISYRKKIDIIWAIVHSVKWVIIFLFGTGVFFRWIAK